jgi:MFS family permease
MSTPAPWPPPVLASSAGARRRPALAALVVLAVGLAFADASIVALALPRLYATFSTTVVGVSWVLTSYAAVVAVAGAALVPLHRRIRPAPALGAGLAVFAAASLWCGMAPSLGALLVGRAVQGVGATLLLAASLPVLVQLLGMTVARRTWAAAGVVGAAVGPVLGGLLTEVLDWRAIFLAQAPVAILALVVLADGGVRHLRSDERPARPRGAALANLGFVLVFAPLVAALFLAVLLLVVVWGEGPLRGAIVVSALPAGMLMARRLSPAPAVVRAIGGPLALAGGLGALALLPAVSDGWAVAALALIGAGFGLVTSVLGPVAVADEQAPLRATTASIAARHAGLVLGLVLIAPVLSTSLSLGVERATLSATSTMLDATMPVADKVRVTGALRDELEATPSGEVPDLAAVFDAEGARSDPRLAATRDDLTGAVTGAITRAFRPAFAVAAVLALAAVLPALGVIGRQRSGPRVVVRYRWLAGALVVAVIGGAAVLLSSEGRAGAGALGRFTPADACRASPTPYPGDGIDPALQRIALSAINGAACELGTTRERLVLSLDRNAPYHDVTWDRPMMEKALRAGADRAIKDADDRDSLPGWVAWLLRRAVQHAPAGWLVDRLPFPA